MVYRKFLWVGFIACLSLLVSAPGFSQEDVIEKRKKIMKDNSATNKELKKDFAKGDYAAVEAKAKQLEENAEMLADLFPKGSTSKDSRAKPEIWEKWDEFGKKLADMKNAAAELASAAETKDQSQIGPKFKALGSTCGDCHKPFRAPKKKKK